MTAVNLDDYLVPGTSYTYYIPDFVTEDEEDYILRKIQDAPQPWWKRLNNRRLQTWGGELTSKKALIPQELPDFVRTYPDIIGRIRETGVFSDSAHGQPNHIIMNEYAPGQGIMPHEDGPAYHPVVATLSLGAHTVFNYYRYKPDSDAPAVTADPSPDTRESGTTSGGMGRTKGPIDPMPVLSLVLEPRSLVITTSTLYDAHLHGIDEVQEDRFPLDGRPPQERVANFDLLRGKAEREAILNGGILERGLRYSLTCRDVEKVAAVGSAIFKKLRG